MVFPWFSHGFPIKNGGSFHGFFYVYQAGSKLDISQGWIIENNPSSPGAITIEKPTILLGKPWENPWENGDLYGQIYHFVAGKINELSMATFKFAFCMFTRGYSSSKSYVGIQPTSRRWA